MKLLRWAIDHGNWFTDTIGCLIVWGMISLGLIALLSW